MKYSIADVVRRPFGNDTSIGRLCAKIKQNNVDCYYIISNTEFCKGESRFLVEFEPDDQFCTIIPTETIKNIERN